MNFLPARSWIVASSLFLTACSAAPLAEHSTSKIVQGHPLEARTQAVVALLKQDEQGIFYAYCTGVLISKQHLLTAAHCSLAADGSIYPASALRVVWGENDPEENPEQARSVRSLHPHPLYDQGQMGKDAEGLIKPQQANDLAVWELEYPVAEAVLVPLMEPQSRDSFVQSEHVIHILGFGQQTSWSSPWAPHMLMGAATPYRPQVSWQVQRREWVAGHWIKRTVTVELPAFSSTEFYAGDKGYPDTCKGDSGGPALLQTALDAWLLVGVTSRGAASCDRGGVYTWVPAYVDWLTEIGVVFDQAPLP